ncbi:AAA family ATPase, partial [Myxococcus sp. AM009]|nr:AAA family ATPase [Myxococcus sp. AM009]
DGALEMIALSAESVDFEDGLKLEGLVGLADNLEDELSQTGELAGQLSDGAPAALERLRAAEAEVRRRVVSALRRRAVFSFQGNLARGRREPLEALAGDSRRLTQLENALAVLDPTQQGLKQELLLPLGIAYAREVLSSTPFERIEQYGRAVQSVAENLRREGVSLDAVFSECREVIESRLREHAQLLTREVPGPPPASTSVLNGDAYVFYRGDFAAKAPDGELSALLGLDGQLAANHGGAAPGFLSEAVRSAVAQAELGFVQTRVKYLRSWLTQLLTSLPSPESMTERADAERTVDRLVRSRFPMLALKEGELVRLRGVLALLGTMPGDLGEGARKLEGQLRGIDEDFGRFSRQVLARRSSP